MVLSKFWTLTVWRATSMTSPSAPQEGTSTQSPTWIMLLLVSWIDATRDMIVSLNTNIITAVRPAAYCKKPHGASPNIRAMAQIEPMMVTKILASWTNPLIGRLRDSVLRE